MKNYFSNYETEYEQPERFLLTCFPPEKIREAEHESFI